MTQTSDTVADARRVPLPRPGPGAEARRMAEMLRVDHSGEFAAVHIYRAQRAILEARKGKDEIAADLTEMQGHEQVHLDRFNALLTEHNVRPSVMIPLWKVAATVLGAGTALINEKAAHACTEAVESVIEKHYADQIEEIKARDPELAAELTQFREEELMHHDHAIAHGSREAPAYRLLSAVIKTGCKAAIKISERI